MLSIAGQSAGPIRLKFFVDTHGWPGGVLDEKNYKFLFFPLKPYKLYLFHFLCLVDEIVFKVNTNKYAHQIGKILLFIQFLNLYFLHFQHF